MFWRARNRSMDRPTDEWTDPLKTWPFRFQNLCADDYVSVEEVIETPKQVKTKFNIEISEATDLGWVDYGTTDRHTFL